MKWSDRVKVWVARAVSFLRPVQVLWDWFERDCVRALTNVTVNGRFAWSGWRHITSRKGENRWKYSVRMCGTAVTKRAHRTKGKKGMISRMSDQANATSQFVGLMKTPFLVHWQKVGLLLDLGCVASRNPSGYVRACMPACLAYACMHAWHRHSIQYALQEFKLIVILTLAERPSHSQSLLYYWMYQQTRQHQKYL